MKTISSTNETIRIILEDLNNVSGSHNLLVKAAGMQIAKAVKRRYNEFLSFPNFGSLLDSGLGHPEALTGSLKGFYAVRLTGNYRLVFRPDCSENASLEERRACEHLLIEGVVDYHGKQHKQNWLIP